MAGYDGYLIKVLSPEGSQYDYILPMHFIMEKSYEPTLSVMDYDSTRNGKGRLIRNAQNHKVPHVAITIKPLWDTQLSALFANLRSRYTIAKEKKLALEVFMPEINDYVEEEFYIPDITPKIRRIHSNNKIKYESFTLEFIGY